MQTPIDGQSHAEDTHAFERMPTRLLEEKTHTEIDNDLKSCLGGTTDKRLIHLVTQIAVSSATMIYSFVRLAGNTDPTDKSMYFSLITGVFGFWLGGFSKV